MAVVFLGVAQPKRRHTGKPGPKPRLVAAIEDLNLTINHKWVVAQEIGSKWGADAPHPIFPSLTCWLTNPDLKGGQQPALSLPSPLLNTAREILALTEEWTQHDFPQKLLSFLLKQAEPKSCEWFLSILDQAPNSFDDASTLISLVTCQSPATSSLIDYKKLFSSSQGPQPLTLYLRKFQANAKKSSLPKSAKLAALYLSLDHTSQSLSPWLHPSASVSNMIQRLLQAVGVKLVTSQKPTQTLLLEAPLMLNCLKSQQEQATPQGPISPEVSQSLVIPAPTLAIAPVVSSSP
ncbi:hypothetical protein DSO57_1008325 [Entomophthora muscae]|uniref:Uncharacterized protein n=1 Tax=Entomophthora muscae TaxID=34485 RepID=A0ACC2RLX4_9FUNG|nr:hypothetical protein DSO57_1008325 [Entomophthora muscae]